MSLSYFADVWKANVMPGFRRVNQPRIVSISALSLFISIRKIATIYIVSILDAYI